MSEEVQREVHEVDFKDYQNPYEAFEIARKKKPVLWSTIPTDTATTGKSNCFWLITDYDLTQAGLKDPRFLKDRRSVIPREDWPKTPEKLKPLADMQKLFMLFRDPPDHTRLRRLVSKPFTPRLVAALNPRMEEIALDLINAMQNKETANLVDDFAFPFPVMVIAELLGVPVQDRDKIKLWSTDMQKTVDPSRKKGDLEKGVQAAVEMSEYLSDQIDQKRVKPQDDLLSAMIKVEEDGDKLSKEEIIATCALLLFAGHETSTHFIGNTVYTLLKHPEQMQQVRENHDLVPQTIEEILRYESPAQLTVRFAPKDMDFGNQRLQKGDQLMFFLGAANRDEKHFEDPNSFNINRSNAEDHLTFGGGVHHCLGAPLARNEARIALDMLLKNTSTISLAKEPEWRESIGLKGLKDLWLNMEK